jgi:hypothetical protein
MTYSASRGYSKAKGVKDIYKSRSLKATLDIKGKIRESRNSAEHPNSYPIILGLDVTGSMGSLATTIAKESLNDILTRLYENKEVPAITDPQVAICAIGDTECDNVPIQMTQFESDIRVAEQMNDIYFEGGGGGNDGESYIAALYCAMKHVNKDASKGLIVTIGDEPTLTNLSPGACKGFFGDDEKQTISWDNLLKEVQKDWDVYHICCGNYKNRKSDVEWRKRLPASHVKECGDYHDISNTVIEIMKEVSNGKKPSKVKLEESTSDPMSEIID